MLNYLIYGVLVTVAVRRTHEKVKHVAMRIENEILDVIYIYNLNFF